MATRFRTGKLSSIDNSHGFMTLWLDTRRGKEGFHCEQRYLADALTSILGLDEPWEGKRLRYKADGQMLVAIAAAA